MADSRRLIVDLSNICCDRRLDDGAALAAWSRFERLLAELADHLSGPPEWTAVADASLELKLTRDNRRRLRDAAHAGQVNIAEGDADRDVLLLAQESGSMVVSNDRFVDY